MMRYMVHRNLNKGGYSIISCKTKLVVGHCKSLFMHQCNPVVHKWGLDKYIKTGVKNVHAFIKGEILAMVDFRNYKERSVEITKLNQEYYPSSQNLVRYNPSKGGFTNEAGEIWKGADYVILSSDYQIVSINRGDT